jgi:hypothetical protein
MLLRLTLYSAIPVLETAASSPLPAADTSHPFIITAMVLVVLLLLLLKRLMLYTAIPVLETATLFPLPVADTLQASTLRVMLLLSLLVLQMTV